MTTRADVDLKAEQRRTLETPRRPYGLLARTLFVIMDLLYGRERSLPKFKVLEVVARVPYQAWEQVAYVAMTHTYRLPAFARRVFEFVRESRAQQDNEMWHLLILEELLQRRRERLGFWRFAAIPQFLAFAYYHVSWMLYVLRPSLSYALNADFEDHAEHEYMAFVVENPGLEAAPFRSEFAADYGEFESLAELFRRIGLDERLHKEESLAHLEHPRFA